MAKAAAQRNNDVCAAASALGNVAEKCISGGIGGGQAASASVSAL